MLIIKKTVSLFMLLFIFSGIVNINLINITKANYVSTFNLPDPETAPLNYIIKFKDEKLKSELNRIISNVNPKTDRAFDQDITVQDARRVYLMYGPQGIDAKGIKDLEGIQYFINLKDLRVSGNTPTNNLTLNPNNDIINLYPIKGLKKLETLNLSNNNIPQNVFENIIPNLINIKNLSISNNRATDLSTIISPLNSLVELSVDTNKFSSIDPIIEKASTLKFLNINANTLTNEELQKLARLTNLESLLVSAIRPAGTFSNIDFLKNLTNLKHLHLSNNTAIKSLEPVLSLKGNLQTFMINGNKFKSDIFLSQVSQLTNLTRLDTSGNQFYDISSFKDINKIKDNKFALFNNQNVNISVSKKIFQNPIKNKNGEIVPITETVDVINVDEHGNKNQNGGYIKINKNGSGILNVKWKAPETPELYKNFSGDLIVNYDLDSIKPTAKITSEPESSIPTKGPVLLTLTASEEIKLPTGWEATSDPRVFTMLVLENSNVSVIITDLSNNDSESSINFDVTNIDNIGPDIEINNPDSSFSSEKEVSASVKEGNIIGLKKVPVGTVCDENIQYEKGTSITLSNENDNGKIICFKAEDDLGNISFKSSNTISGIDTTKPKIISVDADISNGHNNPIINFNGKDNNLLKEWKISIDGQQPVTLEGTNRSYIPSGLVGDGHVVEIELVDKAGNISEKRVLRFPPSVKIISKELESKEIINGVSMEISGPSGMKITDILLNGTGNPTFNCPSLPTIQNPVSVPFSCSISNIDQTGKVEILVTAEGGYKGSSEQYYIIDEISPKLEINSIGAVKIGPDYFTNKDNIDIVFSSEDNGGSTGNIITECSINSGSWKLCTSPYNLDILSEVNILKIRSKDSVGNFSSEKEIIIKKDKKGPSFEPLKPSKIISRKSSAIILSDVLANDGNEGSGLDDVGITFSSNINLDYNNPSKGNYIITYKVRDKVGNESVIDREVEITDIDELILELNKITPELLNKKTIKSVSYLNSVKKEAEDIIKNIFSTQKQIDDILLKLNEAIKSLQDDTDLDGIPDNIDLDIDGDGVLNEEENKYNSDPKDPNSKPNSYNFEPIVKNLLKKASDLKLTEEDIKNSILNKNTFPNGTNIIIDPKNNISDLQNTSGEKNIELTIVYPDGSFDKIIVKLTVELGSSPSKGSLIIKEDKRVNKGIKDKVEEEKEKGIKEELNKEEIKEETNTINKEKIVNGEIKRYSLSNRYLGCPMIPNIVGDYNKDFKLRFRDIIEVKNIDELQRLTKTEVINPGGVNNTGLFEGKRGLTRAEFLAIVLKVHCYDVSNKAEKKRYKDVDLESWQSRVIEVSDKIGITRGYGDGSFRPNAEISKIEAFGIMMKMADIKIKDNYTDRYKDKKAAWQTIPLSSGEYLGILKPEETNYMFNPNGKLSRDEMVKLIVDIVRLY